MSKIILPPLLNAIEAPDPYEAAIARIRQRNSGAGEVFWQYTKSYVELAIVLEPDVDQLRASEMVPLGLVALSDCLAVLLPPQVAVQFRSEQYVIVNGGAVGGVRAAMARPEKDSNIPNWLVLSLNVHLQWSEDDGDPGLHPDVTSMSEEGWEEPDHVEFVETYARHFLSWMAVWEDDGFAAVQRAWKFKAEDETEADMKSIAANIEMFESIER